MDYLFMGLLGILLIIIVGMVVPMAVDNIMDIIERRKNKKNGTYKTVDLLDLHDKANDTTTRMNTMIDLVSNLSVTMASMSGDLEELKVRIEILEKKLVPKKKSKRKKK